MDEKKNMKNNYWNINVSNKNWMRRIFLPVGNGAFYCENFMLDGVSEPINVVFDCGVLPPADTAARLENVIDAAFGEHKVIHAVFLSCLQSAHINGVEILQNTHQIEIKRIYYPNVNSQCLIAVRHKLAGEKNTFARELCQDWSKAQARFPKTQLIPILGPTSLSCSSRSKVVITSSSDNDKVENGGLSYCGKEILLADIADGNLRGRIANSPFADWCFCSNNFLFSDLSLINLGVLFYRHLASKYANVSFLPKPSMRNRFNTNSMIVYSGPKSQQSKQAQQIYDPDTQQSFQPNASDQYAPGCLYTGNVENPTIPVWSELFKAYHSYGKYIGCLQLNVGEGVLHAEKCLSILNRKTDELIFVASTESSDSSMLYNTKMYCITDEEETCLCTVVS